MTLASAVFGIIISPDSQEILLVKRRDVPVWTLPGGGIENSETPESALIREIFEETGFYVKIVRKCAEYSPINSLASFTTIYTCHIVSGQLSLCNETSAIAFYPLSTLPSTFLYLHNGWLQEVLASKNMIQRQLHEVSYLAICKYFIRHPLHILKYAWTRFIKN